MVGSAARSADQARGRLYYGWVMLLALASAQVTSWGILYYSFSVFLKPISNDLGWSRAAMTGAFSLALFTSGVAGIFVGRWVDRHGTRLLMTVGSCVATLLLLALAGVHHLVLFYLIWAVIGGVMAAVFYAPAFAAIATWFIRYRSRALTIIRLRRWIRERHLHPAHLLAHPHAGVARGVRYPRGHPCSRDDPAPRAPSAPPPK